MWYYVPSSTNYVTLTMFWTLKNMADRHSAISQFRDYRKMKMKDCTEVRSALSQKDAVGAAGEHN